MNLRANTKMYINTLHLEEEKTKQLHLLTFQFKALACISKALAQAKPSQSQAPFNGFGLAWVFRKPKLSQARPKLGLSGQAGLEHHYFRHLGVYPRQELLECLLELIFGF
jgi:hypothetical protein